MRKKALGKNQIIRHIVQLIAFVLVPGLFITAFAAIRDLYMGVTDGTFQFETYADQLLVILAVFPVTMILGRFFCGFICSFGALGDFIWWISSKIIPQSIRKRINLKVSGKADKILKSLKYILLVLIVVFLWTLDVPWDASVSPWNVFGMYSSFRGWTDLSYLFSAGGLLLVMIIFANFFIERFFCRYLCPLGAVFAVISRLRINKIRKPTDGCGNCRICTGGCSMGLSLNEMSDVRSGECINCYKCVDLCPRDNIKTKLWSGAAADGTRGTVGGSEDSRRWVACGGIRNSAGRNEDSRRRAAGVDIRGAGGIASGARNGLVNGPVITGVIVAIATICVYLGGSQVLALMDQQQDGYWEYLPSQGDVHISGEQTYEDGVYTGEGTGFRGTMKVQVTVENGKISDIEIMSSNDDIPYLQRALSSLKSQILSSQSPDVDAVSGATFSSKGIMEAVADALDVELSTDSDGGSEGEPEDRFEPDDGFSPGDGFGGHGRHRGHGDNGDYHGGGFGSDSENENEIQDYSFLSK